MIGSKTQRSIELLDASIGRLFTAQFPRPQWGVTADTQVEEEAEQQHATETPPEPAVSPVPAYAEPPLSRWLHAMTDFLGITR